jgi:hypothetical protein
MDRVSESKLIVVYYDGKYIFMFNLDINAVRVNYIFAFFVTIFVASIMPVFPDSYSTMHSWADQGQALADFNRAINIESDKDIGLTWAGPGWLALAKITHNIFGVNIESSLILINRISYLLAIFIFSNFIFIHLESNKKSRSDYLYAFILIATFILSVNFTYSSVIPWSHFIALPFSCAVILLLSKYRTFQFYHYIVIGMLIGFIATIRLFSAQAILAAAAVWFVYLLWRKRSTVKDVLNKGVRVLALCVLGFVLGYLVHSLILGELIIYRQYEGMTSYPLTELYNLRIIDFPVKFIQLFVDPCFFSDCSLNQWNKATTFIINDGVNSWKYPLLLQIPIIGWVAFSWLIYLVVYWRYIPKILEDPVVAIALLAGGAIIFAYTSVMLGGADRLKFGYVRDFMDATFFLTMATVRVMMLLSNFKDSKFSNKNKLAILFAAPIISILIIQLNISENNFIKFPGYAINKIGADVSCNKEECNLQPFYVSSTGKHNFPSEFDDVVMKTTCSEGGKSKFWYGRLSEYTYKRNQCLNGATIVFIPTITSASTRIVGSDYNGEYGGKIRLDFYPDYRLGDDILFGLSGNDVQYLDGGWSGAEKGYRWTDGDNAQLSMLINQKKAFVLTANVAGYIRKDHPEVRVDVLVEKILVGQWTISSDPFKNYTVNIPANVLPENGKLDLEFVIHNPISPLKLGESSDSRNLGLAVRNISISSAR